MSNESVGSSTKSQKINNKLPNMALELIGSKSEGLLQSDLRKLLCIESSKCSKIVSRLEKLGLITRDKVAIGGYYTYLIKRIIPKSGNRIKTEKQIPEPIIRKFIAWKPGDSSIPFCPMDRYLTEVYLLYLTRSSMNCIAIIVMFVYQLLNSQWS